MESRIKLLKKIHELQKNVIGLEVDKEGNSYKYLTGDKLLSVVRPLMDGLGLLLIPEILNVEYERVDYVTKNGNKSEMMAKAKLKFTWYDVEDGGFLEQLWEQNAMNLWDKSVGSLLTYSERYFLMKTLHIQTDADDLENKAQEIMNNKSMPNTEIKEFKMLLKKKKVLSDDLLKVAEVEDWSKLSEEGKRKILSHLKKERTVEKETKKETQETTMTTMELIGKLEMKKLPVDKIGKSLGIDFAKKLSQDEINTVVEALKKKKIEL